MDFPRTCWAPESEYVSKAYQMGSWVLFLSSGGGAQCSAKALALHFNEAPNCWCMVCTETQNANQMCGTEKALTPCDLRPASHPPDVWHRENSDALWSQASSSIYLSRELASYLPQVLSKRLPYQ